MKTVNKIELSAEKKKEIMLAINLELFEKQIISQETYEATNKRILSS